MVHALHISLLVLVAPLVALARFAAGFVSSSHLILNTRYASVTSSGIHRYSTSSEPSSSSSPAEAVSATAKTSGCPFSMPFPRYRIDLSSASSVNKRSKSSKNKSGEGGIGVNIGGLFSGVRQEMDKSAVVRRYADDKRNGRLLFVDCSVSPDSVALAKGVDSGAGKTGAGGVAEDKLRSGMEGLQAAAYFWRAVANVAAEEPSLEGDGTQQRRIVLAFTGASALQCQRLADIASWFEESILNGSIEGLFGRPIVQVEVDDDSPFPTVILERREAGSNTDSSLNVEVNNDNVAPSAKVVEERIKHWVRRVLVDMSICPFTKSSNRSGQGLGDLGIPTGRIAYHHSMASTAQIPLLMADVWETIVNMIEAGPGGKDGVSSILLAAPEFDSNFPLWAGPIFTMLESGVGAAGAEPLIGVVCFHPKYATPDGSSWPGFGHMHSVPRLRKWVDEQDPKLSETLSDDDVAAGGAWQRRTPHAVINVLRADQLEAAEGRRTSPQMYTRNIRVLVSEEDGIGSEKLEEDLTCERSIS